MAITRVFCRLRFLANKDFSVVSKHSIVRNSVFLNNNFQVQIVKQFRTNLGVGSVLDQTNKDADPHDPYSSSSSDSDDDDLEHICTNETTCQHPIHQHDVTVEYYKGLPHVTVPLPSRKERCVFTLKPISNTVGDFLEMLKKEDKGIDVVLCKSNEGIRIASSNTIETLLSEDFKLVINDRMYNVSCPKQERLTGEEIKRLDDIKILVHQLYEVLNVDEHNVQKEVEIVREIETVRQQLLPLENQIRDLEVVAEQRGNWFSWAGLGFMSVQFGILARLTWWEYSWDIMEPVTYFVTYGTAIAMYSYYVLTKEEYILPSVTGRQKLLILHNKAKKMGIDLQRYNQLQDQLVKLNRKLTKLRNPLKISPKNGSTNSSTPSTADTPEGTQITLANIAKTLGRSAESIKSPISSQK